MTITIEGMRKLIIGKCIKDIEITKKQFDLNSIYVIIKLIIGSIEIKIDCFPLNKIDYLINKITISFLNVHNRIIEKAVITPPDINKK